MAEKLIELPLNQIKVKENYRKTFSDKSLKELALSIKQNGVLEPVLVYPNDEGFYLIAGERRVRAAYLAKLATIPAIVREPVSDKEFLKLQLIENIQREGVQYMEEAYGLRELRERCDLDISELAKFIGKSEMYVNTMIKLTNMAPAAQEAARKVQISKSVAFHIARLPHPDYQKQAALDLKRDHKDKLITEWTARKYIQKNFPDTGLCRPRKSKLEKAEGNDFEANWKKYLITFNCRQFEQWKQILKGRIDTQSFSEAIGMVMRDVKK
jgi:ParB family chromosome partitioning protein